MTTIKTLAEAREVAARIFDRESAAVEVEITMVFGSVWVGRDMEIYDKPRFAN
jgi:hypothetical protein